MVKPGPVCHLHLPSSLFPFPSVLGFNDHVCASRPQMIIPSTDVSPQHCPLAFHRHLLLNMAKLEFPVCLKSPPALSHPVVPPFTWSSRILGIYICSGQSKIFMLTTVLLMLPFQISLKSVCTSLSMPLLSHYRSLPSSRFPPPASSPSSALTCPERLCSHPLCFLHSTLFMLSKTILFTHLLPVLCPSLHYDVSTLWSGTLVIYFLYCSVPITWTNSCLEQVLKRYLFTE